MLLELVRRGGMPPTMTGRQLVFHFMHAPWSHRFHSDADGCYIRLVDGTVHVQAARSEVDSQPPSFSLYPTGGSDKVSSNWFSVFRRAVL